MKTAIRSMYLGVACAAVLAPQMASAQSTVTLYGRVVSGLAYIDNVFTPGANASFSKTMVASNQWGTSMWGMKGKEDLGGGLAANFLVESGFDLKNGSTGGALFNRRAYVGLSNDSWGSFRFGKNLFISNDVWDLDPTGQQWVGSATLVRGRSWPGANNVVEYSTPNMEIQASRSKARTGPSGEPILLLDQNRARWDHILIRRGLAALARAEALGGALGPYALQAAIAACHGASTHRRAGAA